MTFLDCTKLREPALWGREILVLILVFNRLAQESRASADVDGYYALAKSLMEVFFWGVGVVGKPKVSFMLDHKITF